MENNIQKKFQRTGINTQNTIPFVRRLRYVFEYVSLRFLMWILSVLPYRTSLLAGRKIGRIAGILVRSRYKIAQKNLLESFPGISNEKVDEIIGGCWENLGRGVTEFSKIPKISKDKFFSLSIIDGLEHVQESLKAGRGLLLVTAHYGSWELAAQILPFSGFRAAVVARRVKNPFVNDFVNRVRSTNGIQVILARNAVRESIRWLKEGNILIMLTDHRIIEGGLQVPFFGRNASTTSLPAILALRYSVPVHAVYCEREGEKIVVRFDSKIDFSDLTQKEEDIYEATLRISQLLESRIKEHPEMWLWIHNRWKTEKSSENNKSLS